MEETFASFVQKERERLAKAREDALARKKAIDRELEEIEREMHAISAYEMAKQGKLPGGTAARTTRAPGAPRGKRGEKREAVLRAIKESAGGLTRGELIEAMGARGDKSHEQSISNALSALTKSGHLLKKGRTYLVQGEA